METIYKEIVSVFNANKQVFIDRGLPTMRQIDIYMGQPDAPTDFEMFLPGMYIDWRIEPGPETEPDILTLDFHVLFDPGAATDNSSLRIDQGLQYIEFIKACKYLLNYLRTDNITPLKWNGERPTVTPYYKYHIITYKASIDTYLESIHRPVYGDTTISSVNITSGKLKPDDSPLEVDTF